MQFEVHLSEGIDLSIFLFGSFQSHVWKGKEFDLGEYPVIFDVGANIGSISLLMAEHYSTSTIYSFEPTIYAFEKLNKNLALNPKLKDRVVPVNCFVSETSGISQRKEAFSSWKIDGSETHHPIHGGINQLASDKNYSIDDFTVERQIEKLNFIKIDVDGFEWDVLSGAKKTIEKFKPIIVFEFMGYPPENLLKSFQQFNKYFEDIGYLLKNASTGKYLTILNIRKSVPKYGGIDILAVPKTKV
ncbi:MAG: FkbM family methyltransferase [Leptospiraceae bacterium]|nr:FkbM family methyltransferase [Leptospiraceae bacterium]